MVKYVYTLGASGERIKVEELDRTVEYTYDELYRLTSETITEGKKVTTYTYAYDSVSNRTLKTVNSDETVYTYNALNQLISENDTTYEYDNAGNLVRVIGTGKTALYEYNSENKLVKATVQQGNNVVVEEYTYDYAGNRTSKTTTTSDGSVEFVKYLNDNASLTNVLVEIGSENVYYTVGADLISQEVDGEVYTYIYDGHGTVRALANEKGEITDTYSYDAFGNLISSTGSTANSYLYCGEQYDETTGLYYLRARYMDTSIGRFISMDTYQGSTADPISLHKYLYANSNPVMNWDPSGYFSLGEMMCVSSIIGGMCMASINVAGYLDGLLSWKDFNLNSMLQTAFEGFLCGATIGLLFGAGIAGFVQLCLIFPALSGLGEACAYAFGLWGACQSIMSGFSEACKGNYFSATVLNFWGWLSGVSLLDSIFTNFYSNSLTDVAARAKATTNINITNEGNNKPTSSSIRYSQDSISSRFKNGSSVDDMIQGLKSGEISIDDVPAIRIYEKDGVLYSLDNRRLYAFKQAGIEDIPYRWATPEEIADESWKFTTENEGTSIQVRGK